MSVTFQAKAKTFYQKAQKENEHQMNTENPEFYYCATSKGKTPRILDLGDEYVFCNKKHKNKGKKRNKIEEYRLEAYLIREALKNDGYLPFSGKKWKLLDSERNFSKIDLKNSKGKHRKLDILAFDEKSSGYIILELKYGSSSTSIKKADTELSSFVSVLEKTQKDADEFYSPEGRKLESTTIKSYIVCSILKKIDISNIESGIIEYDIKELLIIKDSKNWHNKKISFKFIKEPLK